MNTRKIMLATLAAISMSAIASPAFAEDHVDTNEALFETVTTSQISPASLPQTSGGTKSKTLAEEAFDLTDGQ